MDDYSKRGMLKELSGESKQKRSRRMLGKEYLEAEGIVPQLKNALNDLNGTSSKTFISPIFKFSSVWSSNFSLLFAALRRRQYAEARTQNF